MVEVDQYESTKSITSPGSHDDNLEFMKDELARARVVKWLVQVVIVASCVFWAFYWLISPDPASDQKYVETWVGDRTKTRFFRTDGRAGLSFIFQTIPFIVVAALSFVLLELRAFIKKTEAEIIYSSGIVGKNDQARATTTTYVRKWQWSTYPLLVDRLVFGVLTAGEVLGIVVILFLISYNFGRTIDLSFGRIDDGTVTHHHHSNAPTPTKPWQKLNTISFYFGTAAVIPFSLLWIPVSRGSVFLRVLGIPFERAVRYHIWLANLVVLLVTLHSLGYIIFYTNTEQSELIYGWVTTNEKCAVVAGLVAWILSVIIWVTSLDYFRRRFYNLFFSIHHLYLLFSLFWIYHAVWNYHYFVIPMLLFLVDRFLRMVQSSRDVNILSARVLESGAVELKFPLSANSNEGRLSYNTLSTWCIQIASVSKLQWHFFSGTSSPLEDSQTFSIIIKPLGDWTNALHGEFAGSKKATNSCPFSFKARVEGPYGDESDFYLRYKKLVLVSGGIGVTPLLAILRDILHRYRSINNNSSTCLPTSITVYHCVRTPEELCVLNSVDPNQILPGYDTLGLTIIVHAYVTSKDKSVYHEAHVKQLGQLEAGANNGTCILDISKFSSSHPGSQTLEFQSPVVPGSAEASRGTVSSISVTGSNAWVAYTTIASILGYLLLSGFANVVIVKGYTTPGFPNYNRAHIVVACMLLGVGLFGGLVVLLWSRNIKQQGTLSKSSVQPRNHSTTNSPSTYNGQYLAVDDEARAGLKPKASPWTGDVQFYHRPNWTVVFDDLVAQNNGECVGVLVSGSTSMQEDIATECKRRSSFSLDSSNTNVMFHYHSVSFNL